MELNESKIAIILAGEEIAVLNPLSALNTTNDDNEGFTPDVEVGTAEFAMVDAPAGAVKYQWTSKSTLWEKKVYTLTCYETRFEYEITVYGKGRVDTVNYFLINKEDGSKKGSMHEFCEGFYPDVHVGAGDCTYLPNTSYSVYSCLSVPPMFYHSFKIAGIKPYLAFAVVAEMGEHNFCGVNYDINNSNFSLSTDQYGHAVVNGEWTTPKMVVYTADDHYDAGKNTVIFISIPESAARAIRQLSLVSGTVPLLADGLSRTVNQTNARK